MKTAYKKNGLTLYHGNCVKVMRTLPDASFDAVVTDPPYARIKREYGYWKEKDWHAMMDDVMVECRRLLKPSGSAVFILQPNFKTTGSMSLWLWRFLLRWAKQWNLIQDVYWWNHTTPPTIAASMHGLLRSSLKYCLWFGPPDCYRNQERALWSESMHNAAKRAAGRFRGGVTSKTGPSGHRSTMTVGDAASRRGGVTPFNVLPVGNMYVPESGAKHGHGAATPIELTDWFVKYLCPPGGTVLEPFCGTGTVLMSATRAGCNGVGIEKKRQWVDVAIRRLDRKF